MITIDGEKFKVGIVKIERKTRIEKELKGTTLDGVSHYEIIGTYFDYIVTINTKAIYITEYDRLFEKVTEPVESHQVSIPYNQEQINIRANITISNTSIIHNFKNFRRWGEMKITFTSLEPKKEVTND